LAEQTKEFLGVGLKFPIKLTNNKTLGISRYEEDIEESIRIILGTAKGERIMRPDFGCGIHNFIFDIASTFTIGKIKSSIQEALTIWEPRIDVLTVDASTEKIDEGKIVFSIEYRVISTNNRRNFVYDFYLKEG